MYIVWTKDSFGDQWYRHDCDDQEAARYEVLVANRTTEDWVVTQPVEVKIWVDITDKLPEVKLTAKEKYRRGVESPKEATKNEDKEGGPAADQDTGGEGNSPV